MKNSIMGQLNLKVNYFKTEHA